MAKWKSPQEIHRLEIASLCARVRSAAREAAEAVVAGWGERMPEHGYSGEIERAVRAVIDDPNRGIPAGERYDVWATLVSEVRQELGLVQRWARQQRAAERAAEALVDTTRPVVATTVERSRETVGTFCIVEGHRRGESDRVLVCIRSEYVRTDVEDDRESGWYCDYAEPSEAERESAEYQRVAAELARRQHDDATALARIAARRERELADIRASGREPSDFEDMFAGTSDN